MDKAAHQNRRGAIEGVNGVRKLGQLAHDVVPHHGFEQLFFAGEVQKQRALGDASAPGDFFDPSRGKAFFYKQRQSRLQQLPRARLFASLALGLHRTAQVDKGIKGLHKLLTNRLVV